MALAHSTPSPFGARTPQEAHTLFVDAFNAGDLEGILALYEPGAVTFTQPGGQPTHALRQAIEGYLALRGQIKLQTTMVVQNGDLALLRSQWQIKGTAPDGQPLAMTHNSAEVVRRGADGNWRYVIDHPFGGD